MSRIITRAVMIAVVGLCVQAGYAFTGVEDFQADIWLTSNLADPDHVAPGTPVVITAHCDVSYVEQDPGNDVTRIQLNWNDSSSGLLSSALWTWGPDVLGSTLQLGGANGGNEVSDDGIVNRQAAGAGTQFGSPFVIGTLAFDAPAFNGGGSTYGLYLTGGDYDLGTLSTIADGTCYLLEEQHAGGGILTLGDYAFTVTPEPCSAALVGLGCLVLLRRKSTAS